MNHLKPRFIEHAPDLLEDGVLYISIPNATTLHLCCCGCGHEVIAPISPIKWTLIFDGESASLDPSIGNWSQPCRSHYWIRENRVHWAAQWTEDEIRRSREREQLEREEWFTRSDEVTERAEADAPKSGWLASLWSRLRRR